MTKPAPIIDLEFGLSQLSGNRELLIKLLGKFQTEYENLPGQIEILISNNDMESMRRAVHTVKGVSGNLGLSALHLVSKPFEQAIIEGRNFSEQKQAFNSLLAQTCDEIETLSNQQINQEVKAGIDSEARIDPMQVLVDSLRRNEYIPRQRLDRYLELSGLDSNIKSQINDAINDLDYSTALALLTAQ